MLKLYKNKQTLHELALVLERYSLHVFKELLRLQSVALPPSSTREIYRFINSYTFQQYTKLPKLVSDALFGCFSRKQKCDSLMFYSGLEMLLHDTIEETSQVTFAMLDADQDQQVTKAECELMLNHSVAHPSLIRSEQVTKLKSVIRLAMKELFGEKQTIKKEDYLQLAFIGQNSAHTLLWGFVKKHFNLTEQVLNMKSASCREYDEYSHISDSKTQDSLSQVIKEGYLLCQEGDKTYTKKFFKLINRELLEFKPENSDEFCSLRHLGFEAFLEQSRIKDGEYFKFVLKTGAETHTFCTESKQEHDYWVQGIKNVIGQHNYRKINNYYSLKTSHQLNLRSAKSLVDGTKVIIKTLEKTSLDFEGFKQARQEIEILQMCREHEIIVDLLDYFEDSEAFHLVFKPIRRKTLKQYFLKEKKYINRAVVRALTKQLCTAMSFLSKYNILHRNINPDSIFLIDKEFSIQDESGQEIKVPQIQLGDFSCSTILQCEQELSKVCGLASFLAPEAIKFKSYGYSLDMYSLGATIYFLMSGQAPYFDPDINELYKKILNKQPEFSVQFMLNAPADLVQFVTSLVVKNPKQRLSISEVMSCLKDQHRFVGITKLFRSTTSLVPLRRM